MARASEQAIPAGFERTCWRGMEIGHPADWEAGFLSALKAPGRCVFVDRRFQRLEVQWRKVPREPDLRQMYQRVGKSYRDYPSSALTGAAGWEGIVRREEKGSIVHAGRYFESARCLLQVVLVWPGRRDRRVERGVLDSIAPQASGPSRRWRALGLSVLVPTEFELTDYDSQVGRVTWNFRRPGRRAVGLTVERIAMGRYWLKQPLGDWLKTQLPAGFKAQGEFSAGLVGHGGSGLRSQQRQGLRAAVGMRIRRVDLAWSCPRVERVYRVGVWQRPRRQIDWPHTLEVECCRAVPVSLVQA